MLTIKKKQTLTPLGIALIALTVLMFCHEIIGISINQYIFILVATAFLFISKYKDAVYYTAFLMPLCSGMNLVVMWIPYIVLLIKSRHVKVIQYLPAIILIIIELFDNLFLYDGFEIKKLFIYAPYLGIFFFFPFIDGKNVELSKTVRYGIWGITLTCGLLVYRLVFQGELDSFLVEGGRMGYGGAEEFQFSEPMINLNPNCLGYFSLVGYTLILSTAKLIKCKPLESVGLIIILVYAGMLSISRTWLILFVLITIIYAIFFLNKFRTILIGLIIAVGVAEFGLMPEGIIVNFEERMTDQTMDSGGGRTDILSDYNNYMLEHPEYSITGIGTLYTSYIVNYDHSVHNGAQQILLAYGIIGILCFTAFGISFYKRYVNHHKIMPKIYMPFITAFLFLMTIQFLHPPIQMIPLIYCLLALRIQPNVA